MIKRFIFLVTIAVIVFVSLYLAIFTFVPIFGPLGFISPETVIFSMLLGYGLLTTIYGVILGTICYHLFLKRL